MVKVPKMVTFHLDRFGFTYNFIAYEKQTRKMEVQ